MKMVQMKDTTSEEEEEDIDPDSSDNKSSQKRHRKHKHKKHKRRKLESGKKSRESSETTPKSSSFAQGKSPSSIKLKIKIHEDEEREAKKKEEEEMVDSPVQKYVDKIGQGLGLASSSGSTTPSKTNSGKKKRSQKKGSETSSEEERWLDAIQSGKLDEVDEELKKIKPKDPKLMTARQRAMLERKSDKEPEEQLMALPSGVKRYKEVVMTAEAIQRKAMKSQKRKQMADEKREKDKRKTMERLLKKQDSKTIKSGAKKVSRKSTPQMIYRNAVSGPTITFPHGFQFPLLPAKSKAPPPSIKCSVEGCKNVKRYSCSKTGFPVCSLKCYKINLNRVEKVL